MVSGGLVERVEQTYRCSRVINVLSEHIRCSRTTNLHAEIIDNIGICAYSPRRGVAYLANLRSCMADSKYEIARMTVEPFVKRLKKDRIALRTLSAVVFGDSIQSFEYGRPEEDKEKSALHVRRVHAAYRASIMDFLHDCGIGRCKPLFAEGIDTYVEVMLGMPLACVDIRELCQRGSATYSTKKVSMKF